ncbi:MAG: di-trans,poly-cis-decaprenylcistransferase [Oscillospiraceae bacterium]|nr:di-trans,poly-cis-decaprenylcistransferase [Oscillospiraceae bacterium]
MISDNKMPETECLPVHIGIIMDGNGRWAKKRGLPRSAGHSKGAAVFKTVSRYCRDRGIKYLTVYAFSTENWKRSEQEVSGIMNLLREYLRDVKNYTKDNIRVCFIGDRTPLDDDIKALMYETEKTSENFDAMTLNIAINYGGLPEIANAARICAEKVKAGELSVEDITCEEIEKHLYTAPQPAPDLIIRTGGEYRLSNFLTWQSAYSELYFCDVLWPDFNAKHIEAALSEYAGRNRRFGNA